MTTGLFYTRIFGYSKGWGNLIMKLSTIVKSCVLATMFVFSQSVFAQTDAQITTDVQSKLSADKTISGQAIKVTTKNGVVTLTGNVNTDAEASKAVEIASATTGVKDTDTSKLTVKESKQPFTDTAITAKVKGTFIREKLFGDKDVSVMNVNVETTNGVVYLTGTVDTKAEADNAVKLAKSVSGVKSVESKIQVNGSSSS